MWNGNNGPGNNENELPLLEIPAHEQVRFNLKSNDVIHSFWILPFDFKRDVLPGSPEPLPGDAHRDAVQRSRHHRALL